MNAILRMAKRLLTGARGTIAQQDRQIVDLKRQLRQMELQRDDYKRRLGRLVDADCYVVFEAADIVNVCISVDVDIMKERGAEVVLESALTTLVRKIQKEHVTDTVRRHLRR